MRHTAYLLLGSNMGDRKVMLERACALIEERTVCEGEFLRESSVYETQPWGFESGDLFLNQAVMCRTRLEPRQLLETCLEIEKELGRVRDGSGFNPDGRRIYSSRVIDIDILLYDALILDLPTENGHPALQLPHPLLAERLFALEPLAELAPGYVHPVLGKSVGTLRDELKKEKA